ncbi:MAG: sugar ABC transporter permease [Clostridiales bacterium]|nr:sugar ABC transporter permease [Clostridiales bacterium]
MAAPTVKKTKAFANRKHKDAIFILVMLVWPIAHFLLFWVFVNGRTILLTFQRSMFFKTGDKNSYVFVGLDNYVTAFKAFFLDAGGEEALKTAFWNSLSIAPLNVLIILPIAYVCAFVLFKKIKFEGFFRVVFYIPSIISLVILIMLYKYMFKPEFGPIAAVLRAFGFSKDWFDLSLPNPALWPLIYVFCVWAGMGTNVILISSAMSRVPTEILESGKLDGVGFWRECVQIVLPLVWPTMSTLVVFGCMGMFTFTQQPLLFGEGSVKDPLMTVSLYVFSFANKSSFSAVSAATTGLMFCILFTPFIFLIKWFTEKFGRDAEF